MKRSLFIVAFVAITTVAITAGYLFYLLRQESQERSMTLAQALWVCDEAMKAFYPPGSPQSRSIVDQLKKTGLEVEQPMYHSHLCLRLLEADAAPNEAAIWAPFDPENPVPFIRSQIGP